MIERIQSALRPALKHRVWLISDLQLPEFYRSEFCCQTAVNDFRRLGLPCDYIWYLGDAVADHDVPNLERLTAMQMDLLRPLNVPLRFIMGNHDFDYTAKPGADGRAVWPFYEAVKATPGWKTVNPLSEFFFTEELGNFHVVFLSDHADPAGRWVGTMVSEQTDTQGRRTSRRGARGDAAAYPHKPEDYVALRERMAACGKPVIIAGHYAFSGGNRPALDLDVMLPLPPNVKAHFYGHAHMGDRPACGPDVYRKIAWVVHQDIPQIDVASLEFIRADEVRSAFLEIYEDDTLGVYFRHHGTRQWAEAFFLGDKRSEICAEGKARLKQL